MTSILFTLVYIKIGEFFNMRSVFTSYTLYIYIATNGWCEWFTNTKVSCYHMHCGALFTVRLMQTCPPAKLPTLWRSSLDYFKAVWPTNADRWMVELDLLRQASCCFLFLFLFFLFFFFWVCWKFRRWCGEAYGNEREHEWEDVVD